MHTSSRVWVVALTVALTIVSGMALAAPAIAERVPVPVSPGAHEGGSAVEARCPAFHWAGVSGARGYELAVFRLTDDGAEPTLVTRVSVAGDARGFTLPASDCLERGGRYAWSVAVAAGTGKQPSWSAPLLFEVDAAPSLDELDRAIATLERYRALGAGEAPGSGEREAILLGDSAIPSDPRRSRNVGERDEVLPGSLTSPTSGVTRIRSVAATPTLGTPSLRVSANVALGSSSNVFKNNAVFLWDDTDGNTSLGRNALAGLNAGPSGNTALGRDALRFTNRTTGSEGRNNTAAGDFALRLNTTGRDNTAVGAQALSANTVGYLNTAVGFQAHSDNETGDGNVAVGSSALAFNGDGSSNTAIGRSTMASSFTGSENTAAGSQALFFTYGNRNTGVGVKAGYSALLGSDNIFLGSGALGSGSDSNTIRIGGTATGGDTPGSGQQNKTFINGIRGITVANAVTVLINNNTGQLGTVSSSRELKQDIQDLGSLADRLLELRPVAFRYKEHAATDPETPLQFGLVAEEVAEVFPELVVFDEDGKPATVRYHLLSSLLLGELQAQHSELARQRDEIEQQRVELRRLHDRLGAVEEGR